MDIDGFSGNPKVGEMGKSVIILTGSNVLFDIQDNPSFIDSVN